MLLQSKYGDSSNSEEEELKEDDAQLLPHNEFSFVSISRVNSRPFWVGAVVFDVQVVDILFLCLDVIDTKHFNNPMGVRLNVIKYAHNMLMSLRTYGRTAQKIPSKDTIVSLPEEKGNSCQCNSKCWSVPGACTCIVNDDGVTSMMNTFYRNNAMIGRITFLDNLTF